MNNKTQLTFIISICLLSLLFLTNSCTGNSKKQKIDEIMKVYTMARANGDYYTSIVKLNELLALDSTRTEFYDSLSNHYFAVLLMNQRPAEVYIAKSLKLNGNNVKILELSAIVDISKRDSIHMLSAENKLATAYTLSKDYTYYFDMIRVMMMRGSFRESDSLITSVLKMTPIPDKIIKVRNDANGTVQGIKLEAAMYFLKAALAINIRKYDMALALLQKSTSINPEFELANELGNQLMQSMKGGQQQ